MKKQKKKLRIGIDCRTLLSPEKGEKAGVGHYTYYLLKYLLRQDRVNDYVLFVDWRVPQLSLFRKKNIRVVQFPFSEYKKYLPYAYSQFLVAATIAKEKLDAYHSPANVIPLHYKGKSVLTVHDLAIYEHPAWFPSGQDFSTKVLVPKSIARAEKIIAVSESTKKSIIKRFHVPEKKIQVIYEAFEGEPKVSKRAREWVRKKYSIHDKFFFYIGTLEPRKNLEAVVSVFDDLLRKDYKKYKNWQFIIAGAKGWKYEKLFEAIRKAKNGHIRHIGYVPHKEKMALLAAADFFVFPSLWEGFGLPVLEAMGLGTPVLTSKVSSLPEISGKAALLVDPAKISSVKKGLVQMLQNPALRRSLGKKGKAQSRRFSWARTAKETIKIYESVA